MPANLATHKAIQATLDHADPVVRNLRITQSYHEIAVALERVYRAGNTTWAGFATWASKEAGSFIRNEEVPKPLRRFLDLDVRGRRLFPWWMPSCLLQGHDFLGYVRATAEDVSAHIADGNRRVYARLAPLFADFLVLARELGAPDRGRLEELLKAAVERDPSIDEKLERAFVHYHDALFEDDAEARAELVLAANVLTGWHEQVRLQKSIDGALSAPVRRALDDPDKPFDDWPLPPLVRRFGATTFRILFGPAIRSFEGKWKRVATECLMTLGLPGGKLHLGDDLPPLSDGEMFPADLRDLRHPAAVELVRRVDYRPRTTRGSGARDWTDLGDRLNFIVDFFRSRQQASELLQEAFSARQVEAIRESRLPDGRL